MTQVVFILVRGKKTISMQKNVTTGWFAIGKGAASGGCILSPCLFNLYAEYHAGLDESQAGTRCWEK